MGVATYTPADLNFNSVPRIQAALDELKTDHLRQVNPDQFEERIMQYIRNEIDVEETYQQIQYQAPNRTRFYWGHDHDFGTFKVSGRMGTRHIWLLSRFFDHFDVPLTAIKDMHVLDVGCWTGGVSLVLNKLGGKVVAINDIHKYIHALSYMIESFSLEDLVARWLSLYDLRPSGFTTAFDIVIFPGVIYHLSDPIVALRRLYDMIKPGALLCLETMSIDSDEPICVYHPTGWNWLVPSPTALVRILEDTGFEAIKVGNGLTDLSVTNETDPMGANRCFAVARRRAHHVISLGGLSVDID